MKASYKITLDNELTKLIEEEITQTEQLTSISGSRGQDHEYRQAIERQLTCPVDDN